MLSYAPASNLGFGEDSSIDFNTVSSFATLGYSVGDTVTLEHVRVTAIGGYGSIPTDYGYIEDENRTWGIRFYISSLSTYGIGIGDEVSISGTIASSSGIYYISATSLTKTGSFVPLEPYGMTNLAATEDIAKGLFVMLWGKVKLVSTTYYKITDGSTSTIRINCGTMTKPTINKMVRVRAISEGTAFYSRGQVTDLVYSDAEYQPLPFPGKYQYPREWLVLGPFKDSSHANDYELLDVDFIKAYTGVDEYAATPHIGDVVGSKTWTRVKSPFDILALDSALPTSDIEHSVIYVHLYVWAQADTSGAYIVTGANDWLRVWLNGDDPEVTTPEILRVDQTVCSSGRNCVIGDDGPAAVSLKAGLNSLMFKIVNQTDLAALSCQFTQYSSVVTRGYGGYAPYSATALGYSLNP